jgi:hypothetical protein
MNLRGTADRVSSRLPDFVVRQETRGFTQRAQRIKDEGAEFEAQASASSLSSLRETTLPECTINQVHRGFGLQAA